jgi:hypothetical protein
MKDLAACPAFNDCVLLSERASAEQYDLELVLRFLVFRTVQEHDLRNIGDLGEFLTDRMLALSPEFTEFKDTEKAAFTKNFRSLSFDRRRKRLQKVRLVHHLTLKVGTFRHATLGEEIFRSTLGLRDFLSHLSPPSQLALLCCT